MLGYLHRNRRVFSLLLLLSRRAERLVAAFIRLDRHASFHGAA